MNASRRPSKRSDPDQLSGRSSAPSSRITTLAVRPSRSGRNTSAKRFHASPARRTEACLICRRNGSGEPAGSGNRRVPPSMSMRPSRQRSRRRARSLAGVGSRATPRRTGARAGVSEPTSCRSMSGATSAMRPASRWPLRMVRQASKPTVSSGARRSTLARPGSPSSTWRNTASGPYQPQRTPSSLKRTSSPVWERSSRSSVARCWGTRANAS